MNFSASEKPSRRERTELNKQRRREARKRRKKEIEGRIAVLSAEIELFERFNPVPRTFDESLDRGELFAERRGCRARLILGLY